MEETSKGFDGHMTLEKITRNKQKKKHANKLSFL